jgi:hypothetical protein
MSQFVLNLSQVEQPPFVLADLFDSLSDPVNPQPVSKSSLELVKDYTLQEFTSLGLTLPALPSDFLLSKKLRTLACFKGKLIIIALDSEAKVPLIIEALKALKQSNIPKDVLLASKTFYYLQWTKHYSKSLGLRQFLADLFCWLSGISSSQQFTNSLNLRVVKTHLATIKFTTKNGQTSDILGEKKRSDRLVADFNVPLPGDPGYQQYKNTASLPLGKLLPAYQLLTSLILAPTEKIININQKMFFS